MNRPPYICIDFDGTIVEHRFPDIGKPCPGALDAIRHFQDLGAKIILYTMRSTHTNDGNTLQDAVSWLMSEGIELYAVNNNPEQDSWSNSPKVYANIYIDDAAFGCPLIHPEDGSRPYVDWDKVRPPITEMIIKGV